MKKEIEGRAGVSKEKVNCSKETITEHDSRSTVSFVGQHVLKMGKSNTRQLQTKEIDLLERWLGG